MCICEKSLRIRCVIFVSIHSLVLFDSSFYLAGYCVKIHMALQNVISSDRTFVLLHKGRHNEGRHIFRDIEMDQSMDEKSWVVALTGLEPPTFC